ncbi:hypothetical protein [Bdellovibrio svalbardensis]|uniref:Uncharacterized protein n=1 Tax=Bdellovibrio svalbardensis TaxID=2972972 RepID=A0ABT6DLG8_9BACT|nr:hypothetical protein [Bdellovibrio svalbardensis]MDG0817720.1 hypothetical protein [Bdellovibrio svalbardensis]
MVQSSANTQLCSAVFIDLTDVHHDSSAGYLTDNMLRAIISNPDALSALDSLNHPLYELSKNQKAMIIAQGPREPVEIVRESWRSFEFTDPSHHNPESFTYLVHGVMDREGFLKNNGFESISQWSSLSTSLISNRNSRTFGTAGLILKVPAENIFATVPRDFGSNVKMLRAKNEVNQLLKFYESTFGLDKPQDLLKRTEPKKYNEVLISGETTEGGPIQIIGVFVNRTRESSFSLTGANPFCKGCPLDLFLEKARNLNLPIIEIND